MTPNSTSAMGTTRLVHAVWSPARRQLCIWAERPEADVKARRSSGTRAHPFAVKAEALVDIPGEAGEFTLSLPSLENAPLPSPGVQTLTGAALASTETVCLREWRVPCVWLNGETAANWLTQVLAPLESDDLRFWREAALFALDLLRRERFLPALERDLEGRSRAVWLPALNLTEDAARLHELAEAMPAACRSAASEGTARRGVLKSFLGSLVDSMVRSWAEPIRTVPAGVAGTWISALTAPTGLIADRWENLRPLAMALKTWAQPVLAASTTGYRACFRLEPPLLEAAGEEAPWDLSVWLQAIDEPSLLIPAAEVWKASGKALAFAGRNLDSPKEQLLPSLARAGRLFSPIQDMLTLPAPSACELTTDQSYQFLRETAPLLEETGNGVLLPDWWRKPQSRLGMRVKMRSASSPGSAAEGVLTQEALVEFNWELSLGDEPLTREEFDQLVAMKGSLVRLRGRWLEIDRDEIERAIQVWERRRTSGPMSLLEAIRLQAELDGGDASLPITGELDDTLKALFARLQGDERPDSIPPPESFHGSLRHYQQFGLDWLAFQRRYGLGACLADDMGLGKTIQVLAYLLHARAAGDRPPALLVCPTSLVENWRREAERFAPSLRVYIHHGAGRLRGVSDDAESVTSFAASVAGHDLVLTTYPLALRDQEVLRTVEWDTLILDEAQNIKNPGSGQTKAVRTLPAATRIAMTGTPVENRLSDLWSLMEFLNPGLLGSERGFRGRYAVPIERDRDPEAAERLRRLTRPFMLRRVKTDPTVIQDLPPKQEMKVYCSLTPEQATLYQAVVEEMLKQIEEAEGIQRRGLVLAVLSRLKQVCNHPSHYLHDDTALPGRSGKLDRLTEMLEEIGTTGEASLVFTQYAEWGERLQGHLQTTLGLEALFLHGGVPRKKRDEMVARFQQPGGPPVMILSLKAGGVGLNLTRANHVFHYDRWWNPAVENQATDRAFRIGQQRMVEVHKFLCSGTLEDRIDQMIERKQELAESIVGSGEEWLSELSTAQLRDLITLRESEGSAR